MIAHVAFVIVSLAMGAAPTPTLPICTLGNGKWNALAPVHAVAVAPAGVIVAATLGGPDSRDNNPFLLSLTTGERMGELVGHSSYVSGCAVTHDGNSLVTVSLDGTLRWWDLEAKAEHKGRGLTISRAFDALSRSASQRAFLTITNDRALYAFKVGDTAIRRVGVQIDDSTTRKRFKAITEGVFPGDAEALRQIETQLPGPINHASITDDGATVAVVSAPSTVHLCSVEGKPLCTMTLDGKARSRCGFDSLGRLWVFSDWLGGGDARGFEVSHAERGPWKLREVASLDCYWPASFDSQGRFAAVDKHNRVVVFDAQQQPVFRSPICKERITAVDLTKDHLVFGDDGGNCWTYNAQTWSSPRGDVPLVSPPTAIYFDKRGTKLLVGTGAGTLVEWKLGGTWRELLTLQYGDKVAAIRPDPAADGAYALTRELDDGKPQSCIHRIAWDGEASVERLVERLPSDYECMAVMPGGLALLGGSDKGKISVVNLTTATITGHLTVAVDSYCHAIELDHAGRHAMLLFRNDAAVQVGALQHGGQPQVTHVGQKVSSISAISSDGKCFLGYSDGRIGAWDCKSQSHLWNRRVFDGPVVSVEALDAGKQVVALSRDGAIATATNDQFEQSLRIVHQGVDVSAIAFDGQRALLAVGRVNGTVDVYRVESLFHR